MDDSFPAKIVKPLKNGLRVVLGSNKNDLEPNSNMKDIDVFIREINASITSDSDPSSEDEPPRQKRRVCDGNHIEPNLPFNLSETRNLPWKRHSFEAVLNNVRHRSLKRKKALLMYKVAFNWRSAAIVSSPPVDSEISEYLQTRFQAYKQYCQKRPVDSHSDWNTMRYKRSNSPSPIPESHSQDTISLESDDGFKGQSPYKEDSEDSFSVGVNSSRKNMGVEIIDLCPEEPMMDTPPFPEEVACPICTGLFPIPEIENHAVDCASRTFQD